MAGRIFTIIVEKLYRPFLLRFLKKERTFKYNTLTLKINPGVFHPRFFYSSKILGDFMSTLTINGKSVLDLGTGSGILALRAAQLGSDVTASDISELAIQNVKINAEINNQEIKVIQSDLFEHIANQIFDYIFINPPYFAKDPKSAEDYAWFCGSEYQYYYKLFEQLPEYVNIKSKIFMVLSDKCDLKKIINIADRYNYVLKKVLLEKLIFEKFYIYQLKSEQFF